MTILRTPRLVLRRAQPDDLGDLHRLLSDADMMRYWSTPPHENLAETERWLDEMMASPAETSDDFVIELNGTVVGKIGAYRLPEFGYGLHPSAWGRGLASEAMAAFLVHIFARPDVDHLTADVDPRNAASIRLLERHGFRESGRASRTWHTHIGWCDSVYYRRDR
jgi:[ribosomal protein S5]-alanine N-acetyltransferase